MEISISMITQQICIFAYLMSFEDCSFYFVIKRCGQFLKSKMAEGGHEENCRELRGMGKAQILLQAIEDIRRKGKEVRNLPSHLSREVGQG